MIIYVTVAGLNMVEGDSCLQTIHPYAELEVESKDTYSCITNKAEVQRAYDEKARMKSIPLQKILSDTDYIFRKISEAREFGTEEELLDLKAYYADRIHEAIDTRVKMNEIKSYQVEIENITI